MAASPDPADLALMDGWQRGLPATPRPFAEMGAQGGMAEAEVIARLSRLQAAGVVSRVGGVCRPNTAGASTLAAVAAPEWRVDEVAAVIGAEPGVNHAYLREGAWNLWFVVTGPDREDVSATLARISAATGLEALDLPLVRPFNVDLGFSLSGPRRAHLSPPAPDADAICDGDRPILQALASGLTLAPRPFAELGRELGRSEAEIIARVRALTEAGVVTRLGVIVRHRALGWRANAMVVWRVPLDEVERAGRILAAAQGVTLCYQRRPVPGVWDYSLYCMIHARSRAEALGIFHEARREARLEETPHRILFSLRCFKQTGALIERRTEAPA